MIKAFVLLTDLRDGGRELFKPVNIGIV